MVAFLATYPVFKTLCGKEYRRIGEKAGSDEVQQKLLPANHVYGRGFYQYSKATYPEE